MSILYIRLPSHVAAEGLQPGMPLYCHYALATPGGAIEREGVAALSELSEPVKRAQRVVLLLAASDVTLLRVKMPPLSGAKLRAALPNLVEDRLMSDPEECVVVPGEMHGGMRTVAVVSRSWLELLSRTLLTLGARSVSAIPSQLCIPYQAEMATASASEHGVDADIAIRLAEQDGIGLSIVADQPESLAFEVMQSLSAVVPQGAIVLYVPQARVNDYQDSLRIAPTLQDRITLHADNWQRWISGADKAGVDLMTGLGAAAGPKIDWRAWRWPIVLGTAVLLINVIGLNVDWLRLKREANALSNGMIQTYRTAFPKDPVVIDPLAQLRQKLAGAQRDSGQLAPDDFVALAATFSEAWASTGKGAAPIAGLEYRDRALTVKLKPGSEVELEQLTSALASRNLSITQPSAGVWQIRSGK
ncbi:MAG TPA: type II secretion system protein GspL [Noviherbaspirillum sp.]|nr:type II secretion system protein GspL [Noviherbaspirillum sp.]